MVKPSKDCMACGKPILPGEKQYGKYRMHVKCGPLQRRALYASQKAFPKAKKQKKSVGPDKMKELQCKHPTKYHSIINMLASGASSSIVANHIKGIVESVTRSTTAKGRDSSLMLDWEEYWCHMKTTRGWKKKKSRKEWLRMKRTPKWPRGRNGRGNLTLAVEQPKMLAKDENLTTSHSVSGKAGQVINKKNMRALCPGGVATAIGVRSGGSCARGVATAIGGDDDDEEENEEEEGEESEEELEGEEEEESPEDEEEEEENAENEEEEEEAEEESSEPAPSPPKKKSRKDDSTGKGD